MHSAGASDLLVGSALLIFDLVGTSFAAPVLPTLLFWGLRGPFAFRAVHLLGKLLSSSAHHLQ